MVGCAHPRMPVAVLYLTPCSPVMPSLLSVSADDTYHQSHLIEAPPTSLSSAHGALPALIRAHIKPAVPLPALSSYSLQHFSCSPTSNQFPHFRSFTFVRPAGPGGATEAQTAGSMPSCLTHGGFGEAGCWHPPTTGPCPMPISGKYHTSLSLPSHSEGFKF